MDFRKLPSNSEGLLLKLVCSENPTQVLREQYNGLSTQQEQELDGIIRELKGLGYIDVKWANNEPYFFIAYIVEERTREFGDRWMAEGEIENIRQWESKNTLDSTLSNNYGSCLEFFIQNELVYASSWTSYGNPREYTLFPSLQELLFNCPHKIMEELQKVKDAYHLDLPF